jgi:hypothetical protein
MKGNYTFPSIIKLSNGSRLGVNAGKCVGIKGKHSQDSQVEFTFWKLKVLKCPKCLDQGLGNQVLSKLGLI